MKRRNFIFLSGAGIIYAGINRCSIYKNVKDQKIHWKKSSNSKLFHQLLCEGSQLVSSEQLGLLNVKCTLTGESFQNKELILNPDNNFGQLHALKVQLKHSLHKSNTGNGEDILQGILTIKNESRRAVRLKVCFMTSAQPHINTNKQKICIPISASGLSKDKRLAEMGSMEFLQECEQVIGGKEFSCHYLEPYASDPNAMETKALILAPVVNIQNPSSSWKVALFTPSEEPYHFATTVDEKENVGWTAERQVEVLPGKSMDLRCFLFCHQGEAYLAWNVFHQMAHEEEFEPIDWLHNVKVHYYDFLSSADGKNGIRGDGYEADIPFFNEFKVGLATQHGYYPYIGDFMNPDRKTWMAMQGDPLGPARMSIQKMKARITATRKIGARAGVYMHTVLFDEASPSFNLLEDSILVGPDGQQKKFNWKGPDTVKQNWWMSFASKDWTSFLLKQAEYIMEILNPDAIVFDETFVCLGYDHHPQRHSSLSKHSIEFFKELRRLVHSYGNEKAILTSDCGMSNMVMWADGEAGDHSYSSLLGHPLYRKEPIRYKAALGQKPWIPCSWHFKKMWEEQMDLALKLGTAIGVSNGWIEFDGLHGLDPETRSNLLKDINKL
jgi:hypothetical protein